MRRTPALGLETLRGPAESAGLALRGGFHPEPKDRVPPLPGGGAVQTLVLLGFVGGEQWPAFAASQEYADGRPHALDRWSRRLIDALGTRFGAVARYPSGGPPWLPFQQWARRAEPVHGSPLGLLIHPDYGLWHSYRGALCFRTRIDLPEPQQRASPCDSCAAKPCLATCPVEAVAAERFDHRACAGHLASAAGADCMAMSCRARRSCPIGAAYRYGAAQSAFHMAAFARAQNGAS